MYYIKMNYFRIILNQQLDNFDQEKLYFLRKLDGQKKGYDFVVFN